MPPTSISDLDLHCLPITLFGVSQLKWAKDNRVYQVNILSYFFMKTYIVGNSRCLVLWYSSEAPCRGASDEYHNTNFHYELFVCLSYDLVNTVAVMLSWSVNLLIFFLRRLCPLSKQPVVLHTLSSVTDNSPS